MTRAKADILIIGSGFGGSVAALRAAEAGLRTVVLERGQRQDTKSRYKLQAPCLTRHTNGPAQIHTMPGLLALTGNALGGGSQIYTAVKMPPPPDIFDSGWPEGMNWQQMQPWFDRVRGVIQPTVVSSPYDRQIKLRNIAADLGGKAVDLPLAWKPLHASDREVATNPLDFRGQWSAWQRGNGKRPLTETYLMQAESLGATFCCASEAIFIEPRPCGFRVGFRRRVDGAFLDESILADKVVIAAGTLNTLRLLFQCRAATDGLPNLSPMLGRQFYTNGDLGAAFWRGSNLPLPDDGPLVTAWIDLWERERLFFMESGRFPISHATATAPWLFGIMGDPPLTGQITFGSERLRHQFDRPAVGEFHQRVASMMKRAAEMMDARRLIVPSALFTRRPVTVHPLGGARMGDDPAKSVINGRQEVFGYPGLYVLDGAAMPRQLGAPPSLTIAACAERAMALMLDRG